MHVKEASCNHLYGRNISNIVIIKGENAKSDVINFDWIICSLPQWHILLCKSVGKFCVYLLN